MVKARAKQLSDFIGLLFKFKNMKEASELYRIGTNKDQGACPGVRLDL